MKTVDYIFNIPTQLGTLGLWDYEDAIKEASKYKNTEIRYRVATESYLVYVYPRKVPNEES
jgi:hypothetical protein